MTASAGIEISSAQLGELGSIVGVENVLIGAAALTVYECDAYTLEKGLPGVVVLPRTTDQVARVVRLCARDSLSVIPRGAGTSLSGTILAVNGGVMIGLSRMTSILNIDIENRRALVEAGCVNAWITNAVRQHGLYYAPDPSSQSACTIGGNVGTNSGGPHTLKYGVTTNHVLGFEMVLPDGNIVWLGSTPDGGEDVEGLDIRGAAIGSEGMFGIATKILVKLVRSPQAYKTLLAIFENVDDASQSVSDIIRTGILPAALERMDQLITQAVEKANHFGFPVDAGAVLIIELDGHLAGLDRQVDSVIALCMRRQAREVRVARSDAERVNLWKCRKRAFGAIGRLSPNFITQDGVVPRSKLPEMMRFIAGVSHRTALRIPNVFHAGDGNLHPLILYDERDPDQVRRALLASDEILTECIRMGGSVSGEHGIGVEKMDFMARQFSVDDLDAMRMLRLAFDPEQRCNPHKMFPDSKRCGDFRPRRQASA